MDKKKILIVDDEADVLKVLDKRLTSAGYEVIQASNGREAIISAKKERPQLIILDILMPEMDGGDVANRLKNDPATKDIPVIFLTCLVRKEEEKNVEDVGAGRYFVAKPFNADELLAEIKEHL